MDDAEFKEQVLDLLRDILTELRTPEFQSAARTRDAIRRGEVEDSWISLFPALPMRAFTILVRAGLTPDDVRRMPDAALLGLRNMGHQTLAATRKALG